MLLVLKSEGCTCCVICCNDVAVLVLVCSCTGRDFPFGKSQVYPIDVSAGSQDE